jgi:short-subunit dehydrogenase
MEHTQHPGLPALAKTAVVTGAGRGIGRGLALGLAAAGYDVGLVGRTRERLDAVAAEIAAIPGGPVRTVVAAVDLTDGPAVRAAAATLIDALGGVALLINNAGVREADELRFADDDIDDAWRVIENNLRGPMEITHALLPAMLRAGGGRIVSINSGLGHRAGPAYTAYGISKGALSRFTSVLDAQYREQGIRAFDLAPGVVPTEMSTTMPVHAGRTEWTPLAASVDLVLAIGSGELDRLCGRFLRAGSDTVAELAARTYEILIADARRLRLVPYGPTDPLGA